MDAKVITELIYFVKDIERPLLGREAAEKLKLGNRVDTVSSDDYKTKIASQHPQLFTGLGQMRETYTMTHTPSHCSRKGTASIVPENEGRAGQDAGDRSHFLSGPAY